MHLRPAALVLFLCLILGTVAPQNVRAASVNSDGLTGQELLRLCSSKYDTEYGFCAGYISAIANVMLSDDVGGARACTHGPVRTQQLIDIYRSYAEIFPENLKGSATKNVAVSISRGFPCRDMEYAPY